MTREGADEDLAATGDLDIRRGVTIRPQQGGDKVTIDANGIDRVFHTPFQGTSTPFSVYIFDVKIVGGDAGDNPGGGIFHDARDATMNLSKTTVSGNKSTSVGGGIFAQRGPLNLSETTISGNEAEGTGGGIQGSNTLTLENTTVSGNQSNIGGGIISYATLRITDSTIAFNTAQNNSGGIYINSGTATLKNTIVSNNKSGVSNASKNCSAPVTSEGNNLEKGTTCGFTQSSDINADPKLGELKSNGGPTKTHALEKGSPAINAGGDPFPPTDQRGVSCYQGAANDIGAYERKQKINVVQCPTGGSSSQCAGTSAGEALVGRDDEYDQIQGGEGKDIYNGKGSCDFLEDASLTSSDRYLISVEDFCNNGVSFLSIRDDGGKKDVLDLSRFYESTDFVLSKQSTTLYMDGPGVNDIGIYNFFKTSSGKVDSIDSFVFSDKTLTAKQVKNMID